MDGVAPRLSADSPEKEEAENVRTARAKAQSAKSTSLPIRPKIILQKSEKTTSDSSSLRGSPPTFSGQTRRDEERHEARGYAPANQTPAHLQSPSRGALAVVEQKENHDFKSESAAESCAQDANDPALWTRVAKAAEQKEALLSRQSVLEALVVFEPGGKAK